ncbi:MAG TPA: MBL fold metallo-hydrolase [Blastocatellia bacterium]
MGVYLRQLLTGRDFATADVFATQMANFVYLVGDSDSRECMAVDPAWDIDGILNVIDRDGMKLTGVLVTHYHPDHVGGEIFGRTIAGLEQLMEKRPVRIHTNQEEDEGVRRVTGLSESDTLTHQGGDRLSIGAIDVTLLHTPGHTPGSQCFLVESRLVSGDTLFIDGCGRVDLPGGDAGQMYHSLTQVLAKLPDDTIVYPGHNYAATTKSTIGEQKAHNSYMRVKSREDWLRMMQ